MSNTTVSSPSIPSNHRSLNFWIKLRLLCYSMRNLLQNKDKCFTVIFFSFTWELQRFLSRVLFWREQGVSEIWYSDLTWKSDGTWWRWWSSTDQNIGDYKGKVYRAALLLNGLSAVYIRSQIDRVITNSNYFTINILL